MEVGRGVITSCSMTGKERFGEENIATEMSQNINPFHFFQRTEFFDNFDFHH